MNRVLFVGHRADRTGAPMSLLRAQCWLHAHAELRFETLLLRGGALEPAFRELGPVSVLERTPRARSSLAGKIANRALLIPGRRVLAAARARRLLRRADLGLVFVNSVASAPILERFETSAPLVCRVPELPPSFEHFGAERVRRLLHRARALIAPSRATAEALAAWDPALRDRVVTIHGCVPFYDAPAEARAAAARRLRERLGIGADALVVGGAGTPDHRKGVDLFVQLAARASERLPGADLHFVWVGGAEDGADLPPLAREAQRLGLAKRVHFPGATDRPRDAFAACDLFASTSREDPFPLVCVEAAAEGVPVLCFAGAGGAPELVEDDAGRVVPYLDVDAMADAIAALAADPGERRALGAAAAEKVRRRHDVDVAIPRVLEVIERHRRRAATISA